MNLTRFVITGVLAGMLSLAAGCSWFKSSEDIDPVTAGMVPGSEPGTGEISPAGGPNDGTSGPGGFKNGGGEGLAGGAGDWQPIPGLKFQTVYFQFDSDRIPESERGKLEQAADYLQKNPTVGLIIEGNCDERGSAEYNRGLGERRAISVRQYLNSLGIQDNRFKTISYGEERPAVQGHDEAAWAKNRRAELLGAKMK